MFYKVPENKTYKGGVHFASAKSNLFRATNLINILYMKLTYDCNIKYILKLQYGFSI